MSNNKHKLPKPVRMPHIPLNSSNPISLKNVNSKYFLRENYYLLNEIMEDKGKSFYDFFGIDEIENGKELINNVYRNEDLVRSIIKKSDLIKKYVDEDSLSYVKEYADEVSESLDIVQEYTEDLADVFTNMEESYEQLKKLLINILQYEDIDLSNYSEHFTKKDRDIQIRKRKINSILDGDEDTE